MNNAKEIAEAAISECDRLSDSPTMMVSGTSLRILAEDYLVIMARLAEAEKDCEANDRVRKEYLAAARKAVTRAETAEAELAQLKGTVEKDRIEAYARGFEDGRLTSKDHENV